MNMIYILNFLQSEHEKLNYREKIEVINKI